MEMKLNLNIPQNEIVPTLEKLIKDKYLTIAHNRINEHFAVKNSRVLGGPADGVGTVFVHSMIDDLLTNESITKKVKNYVDKHFERILEEAVIVAITHSVKKEVHSAEALKNVKSAVAEKIAVTD